VWNDRNPMGRMGIPHELTGPLVLLCSDAGSFMNAADLVVDGIFTSSGSIMVTNDLVGGAVVF
jgi:NAD(P)-dependent dehydrogenase (short-subunit alcohol dehydrogenase family)